MQSLEMAQQVASNIVIRRIIDNMRTNVRAGGNLGEPVSATTHGSANDSSRGGNRQTGRIAGEERQLPGSRTGCHRKASHCQIGAGINNRHGNNGGVVCTGNLPAYV